MKIELTEPERAALRDMWVRGVPFADVVEAMGYGHTVTRREIRLLGLPHRKPYPKARLFRPEEDEIIRAYYGRYPVKEWRHLLPKRSEQAIINRAKDYLGLLSDLPRPHRVRPHRQAETRAAA